MPQVCLGLGWLVSCIIRYKSSVFSSGASWGRCCVSLARLTRNRTRGYKKEEKLRNSQQYVAGKDSGQPIVSMFSDSTEEVFWWECLRVFTWYNNSCLWVVAMAPGRCLFPPSETLGALSAELGQGCSGTSLQHPLLLAPEPENTDQPLWEQVASSTKILHSHIHNMDKNNGIPLDKVAPYGFAQTHHSTGHSVNST